MYEYVVYECVVYEYVVYEHAVATLRRERGERRMRWMMRGEEGGRAERRSVCGGRVRWRP
jgi:hypothetical protein